MGSSFLGRSDQTRFSFIKDDRDANLLKKTQVAKQLTVGQPQVL